MRRFDFTFALTLLAMGLGASAASAYQEIQVCDGGTIVGRLNFNGKIPEPQHFLVQKNPDVCGNERDFAFVRVSNGTLENVVVVLEGVEKGKPFVSLPTEFGQSNREIALTLGMHDKDVRKNRIASQKLQVAKTEHAATWFALGTQRKEGRRVRLTENDGIKVSNHST